MTRRTFVAFVLAATAIASTSAAAASIGVPQYWGLIVHGGNTTHASYNKGVLRVEFRHSRSPAGDALHYEAQLPEGQAAWPDRPLSPQEPSVLFQTMPPTAAAEAMAQLAGSGYWEFFCRNTGKGYFDVSTSKSVHSSTRID